MTNIILLATLQDLLSRPLSDGLTDYVKSLLIRYGENLTVSDRRLLSDALRGRATKR